MLPNTSEFKTFSALYEAGKAQIITSKSQNADLDTPVSAYLKLSQGETYSFLLESVQDGEVKGRYSMIGLAPDLLFRVKKQKAEIKRGNKDYQSMELPPIQALRQLLKESYIDIPEPLPSMSAGIFGYMSYDTIRYVENLPDNNPNALDIPESLFIRPSIIAIFDDTTHSLQLVTPVYPEESISAKDAYHLAQERLATNLKKLNQNVPTFSKKTHAFEQPKSNISREHYYDMVNKAREYIKQGDVFQVVLSQRFSVPFHLPPFELYRALRRINPSPYLFFLNFEEFSIVGSSPEVLVSLKESTVNIRPIAGTRPRGNSSAEDTVMTEELLADEKERAEHLMLLDLGRNDVGRVCQTKSVKVNEAFGIQKTSHLIHIVSDITGTILPQYDQIDALFSGFPAGTVSGAPKLRAIEIIDELETERRGIYAGCVGYFSANGDMDSCIALRTGVIKENMLYVQAGGGVVYDSTPEDEFQETVNKAKALFAAAEIALNNQSNG